MASPKFNFIPERQLGEHLENGGCWRVSLLLTGNSTMLYFPKEMVEVLEMDGKYFRMYADVSKNVIGWTEVKGDTSLEILSDARLAKKNKHSGALLFSVSKIIKNLNYTQNESLKGLEVNIYRSAMIKEPVSYVILPEPKVEIAISEKTEEVNNVPS